MSDKVDTYGLAPGGVKGPMLDKGQWPTFFDYSKASEGETVFSPKPGFRFKNVVPAMHADKSVAQSIAASTETIVLFDSVLYDSMESFSPHTGIFVVPVDGLYSISVSVQWAANTWTVGQNISLWIKERKSGTKYNGVFITITNASSYAHGASCSITVPGRVGDQICATVSHTNAAARSLSALEDFNCISVAKVGDI